MMDRVYLCKCMTRRTHMYLNLYLATYSPVPIMMIVNNGITITITITIMDHIIPFAVVDGCHGNHSITGGRHGYGAKLTNIFSSSFTVDIHDAKAHKYVT